jgi:hypothetical protein
VAVILEVFDLIAALMALAGRKRAITDLAIVEASDYYADRYKTFSIILVELTMLARHNASLLQLVGQCIVSFELNYN